GAHRHADSRTRRARHALARQVHGRARDGPDSVDRAPRGHGDAEGRDPRDLRRGVLPRRADGAARDAREVRVHGRHDHRWPRFVREVPALHGDGRREAQGQTVIAWVLAAALAVTDTPTLATVLGRAGSYVAEFERQRSGIAGEEHSRQEARSAAGRAGTLVMPVVTELKSDLLLVRTASSLGYVQYRDVFEVDGKPVRDRAERRGRARGRAATPPAAQRSAA